MQSIKNEFVFGHLGRWDPVKDHSTLLNAAAIFKSRQPDKTWHLVLAGPGISYKNQDLLRLINERDLQQNITILGIQDNVQKYMCGLDCFVLSSKDEGFPNVLGEAMACMVPCITSDVGDAIQVIGDTGWAFPRNCPQKCAESMEQAYQEHLLRPASWSRRRSQCRSFITRNFDVRTMVINFENHWTSLLRKKK
jgi:glycosyltransferase involved in cell wall biosynthesis